MEKTKQKVSQEGWRTTKKERRNYIVGDLGRTLEQLAVRRAMTELDAPAAAQPCHAS